MMLKKLQKQVNAVQLMVVVKNLDQESVVDLLVDLQIIALEGEGLENEQEGGISR